MEVSGGEKEFDIARGLAAVIYRIGGDGRVFRIVENPVLDIYVYVVNGKITIHIQLISVLSLTKYQGSR